MEDVEQRSDFSRSERKDDSCCSPDRGVVVGKD